LCDYPGKDEDCEEKRPGKAASVPVKGYFHGTP
jgi:hypothetical protein